MTFTSIKKVASIVGNAPIYKNYLQSRWKSAFEHYVENLCQVNKISSSCDICGIGFYLPVQVISNYKDSITLQTFLNGIRRFDV